MLSLTCKNAIKAVIYLSKISKDNRKVNLKDVAKSINASEHTVGKILQMLAKKKIISSFKGPTGGFFLTTSQQDQPIIHIVQAIDGDTAFKECGLGLSKCSSNHPCPIHHEYKVARDLIKKIFEERNIRSLGDSVEIGLAHLIG